MKRKIISVLMVAVMLISLLPSTTVRTNAATALEAEPYPYVEYGYSENVQVETIRYIAQNTTGSEYFNWNYWPNNSFGGYKTPNKECGTACISMALSYVGVNRTPKVLLEATNGYTGSMWGQQGDASSRAITISASAISSAMDDYIKGNGKYSPLCVYIIPYSATSDMHWILLVGKIGDNKYLALNPWHTSGTNGTFTIQINGNTATYNGITNPITSVNQWYNPNAVITGKSYPSYGTITITSDNAYVKSLPYSRESDPNSDDIEIAEKGTQYTAIGLVKNIHGNLWHKVEAKSGGEGYVYAGNALSFKQKTDNVTITNVSTPTELVQGDHFPLYGDINAGYQSLCYVSGFVYDANGAVATGTSVNIDSPTYSIRKNAIDNDAKFNTLGVGSYTYMISVKLQSTYAKSATETATATSGEIKLYQTTFRVVSGTTSCSHSYSSTVTTAATCATNGVRTYTCSKCGNSYTESIAATGNHVYSGKVTTAATCTATGVKTYTCNTCSASYIEAIAATGHSYGNWVTTTAATCMSAAVQTKTCSACGDEQTQSITSPGHSYQSQVIPATCEDYEKIRYTCSRCQHSYEVYTGDEYSEWSTEKPAGVAEELIESKQQYRYADYETTTSYETSLSGYTQLSSAWQSSGTGTVQYLKSWPAGFLTSHSLYSTYNNTPKTAAETATNKTTINSDKISGYLYYHWCRGTYSNGPIDRKSRPEKTGEFVAFHAFYSTTAPSSLMADPQGAGSYKYSNGSCCKDSHWYYCVPVYTQSYTTYRNLFTYGKWGNWSAWSDTTYAATTNRKVETRTVYRYVNGQLGTHTWNNGAITTDPACTTTGVKTYTCTACGTTKTETVLALNHNYQNGYCIRCDAKDPNYQFITAQIATGTVTGKTGDTVTVPVTISDNPGIAGFTLVLDYDATAFTLTDITKGEVLSTSDSGAFTKNVSGNTVNWMDAVNVTGNGVLFYLTFKISDNAATGNYPVSIALKNGNSTNLVDEKAHSVNCCFTDGAVTVEKDMEADPNAPRYEMVEVSATAGSIVDVYISVANNPGVISLRNTITYDTTALELIAVQDCGLLSGYTTPSATITSPYTLRWADSLATANNMSNGQIVKLTFQIKEDAALGDYDISVNHIEARNADGEKIAFNGANAKIYVKDCMIGDADDDGEITDWDGILLSRYLAGWFVVIENIEAMDTDGDGEISDWDGVLLDRYLAGWSINSQIGK